MGRIKQQPSCGSVAVNQLGLIGLKIKYPVKTKEVVVQDCVDLKGQVEVTRQVQTVYHRKNRTHYVNYLDSTRDVRFDATRLAYVIPAARQIALERGEDIIKMLKEGRFQSITMLRCTHC